jgi:hypothetical protein
LASLNLREDDRTFSILVKGDKGEMSTTINVQRRGEKWEVVSALGYNDDGSEVVLMGGPR